MPKRRAASRWLSPSTWQAWRTRAYSSTAFILTLPAVRTGRKIRRRLFTPPPRPDTPAASVRDFLSAAHMLHDLAGSAREGAACGRPVGCVGGGRTPVAGWRAKVAPYDSGPCRAAACALLPHL